MKKIAEKSNERSERNWLKLKHNNAIIAQKLRRKAGTDTYHYRNLKTANELEGCGNWLKYKVDNKGNKRLHNARFCHNKLCQNCELIRYNRESARLYQVVKMLKDKEKFLVGTFTIKNIKYEDIHTEIPKLNYAFSKLIKYKVIKNYLHGYVKRVELKVGKDGKCNLHLHVLFAVSSSFYYGKNSLNHSQWSKLWARAVKKDYIPECKVERKTSYNQLKKACNYIVKSYICGNGLNDWDIKDIDRIIDITDGTYRKHLIVYSGVFSKVDNVVNARYKRQRNKLDTGKHLTYNDKDNFKYHDTKDMTMVYKKIGGVLKYHQIE